MGFLIILLRTKSISHKNSTGISLDEHNHHGCLVNKSGTPPHARLQSIRIIMNSMDNKALITIYYIGQYHLTSPNFQEP